MDSTNRKYFRELIDLAHYMLSVEETVVDIASFSSDNDVVMSLGNTSLRIENNEYKCRILIKSTGKEVNCYIEKGMTWRLWDVDIYKFISLYKKAKKSPMDRIKKEKDKKFEATIADIKQKRDSSLFEKEVLGPNNSKKRNK